MFVVIGEEEGQEPGSVYLWILPGLGDAVMTSTLGVEGFL